MTELNFDLSSGRGYYTERYCKHPIDQWIIVLPVSPYMFRQCKITDKVFVISPKTGRRACFLKTDDKNIQYMEKAISKAHISLKIQYDFAPVKYQSEDYYQNMVLFIYLNPNI